MRVVAISIIVLGLIGTVSWSLAADSGKEADSLSPKQVGEKVLGHLNAGRQSEAEELLEKCVAQYPDILRIISLCGNGQPDRAKELLFKRADHLRDKQRIFFLYGACERSRFAKVEAFPIMMTVAMMDMSSAAGRCALHVIHLDSSEYGRAGKTQVDAEFAAFAKLADANPDDVMVRWMLAVQCRTWNRNEEGARQYKKMLDRWNPGPVLVHQTYANLLDELKRYDDALVERRKAVEMEPAGWSLDGLGHTLDGLGRFEEAYEAHARAVQLDPDRSLYWSNWAHSLNLAGKHDEAIRKCEQAVKVDPRNQRAWRNWGDALKSQGSKEEALQMYKKALTVDPKNAELQSLIADLEKEPGK
jgi:tetratricopeptide (TPR) repeat protein